ncbi:hypothetical protein B8T70_19505 [Flavobacterium sp. AJR]|nr:hypothetical protein B8T70_19505 [Flavobacterium sp. AJR]
MKKNENRNFAAPLLCEILLLFRFHKPSTTLGMTIGDDKNENKNFVNLSTISRISVKLLNTKKGRYFKSIVL